MKAYVVGGAVRDELLGLPLKDKDYVVVGADPGSKFDKAKALGVATIDEAALLKLLALPHACGRRGLR